jgi:hypothetical protein
VLRQSVGVDQLPGDEIGRRYCGERQRIHPQIPTWDPRQALVRCRCAVAVRRKTHGDSARHGEVGDRRAAAVPRRASAPPDASPCVTRGSVMLNPAVRRGFSEAYGPWKIYRIFRRRPRRSSGDRVAMSSPSNRIVPLVGSGSCMVASVRDFHADDLLPMRSITSISANRSATKSPFGDLEFPRSAEARVIRTGRFRACPDAHGKRLSQAAGRPAQFKRFLTIRPSCLVLCIALLRKDKASNGCVGQGPVRQQAGRSRMRFAY